MDVPQKPESLQERNERLTIEIKNAFGVLAGLGTNNTMYGEHFKRDRVIVDIPYILELFNRGCQHSSCSGTSQVQHHNKEGVVLRVTMEVGHLLKNCVKNMVDECTPTLY